MASENRLSAQARSDQVLYAELLGNGGLISVNYERAIALGSGIRVGASYMPGFLDTPDAIGVPLMANIVAGGHKRKFEVGLGVILRHRGGRVPYGSSLRGFLEHYYTFTLAYRFESEQTGRFFKFGLTPVIGYAENHRQSNGIVPWIGLSFGRVF